MQHAKFLKKKLSRQDSTDNVQWLVNNLHILTLLHYGAVTISKTILCLCSINNVALGILVTQI